MTRGREPMRMCIVCRKSFPKQELLRHVLMEKGTAHFPEEDPKAVKPGRGYYVCSNPECRQRFTGMKFKRKKRGSENG